MLETAIFWFDVVLETINSISLRELSIAIAFVSGIFAIWHPSVAEWWEQRKREGKTTAEQDAEVPKLKASGRVAASLAFFFGSLSQILERWP